MQQLIEKIDGIDYFDKVLLYRIKKSINALA